jgi:uncharacterized protein
MVKFLIIFAAFVALGYLLFGKRKRGDRGEAIEDLARCETCGTYVAVKDAIIKSGKYYCSKSCAGIKK